MKTVNYLFVSTVILYGLLSIGLRNADVDGKYKYVYNNNYIRDTVLFYINFDTIGAKHLFVINENMISESEMNDKLSSINKDDIISIAIINKSDALRIYGKSAKDGVVKINYYIDPLLKPEYYVTNNSGIMNAVDDLISQGKVVKYPLIVLEGKPLRGDEIKQYLDNLNNESYNSISVLNFKTGLHIYGERAINGVVLIDTK